MQEHMNWGSSANEEIKDDISDDPLPNIGGSVEVEQSNDYITRFN